MSAGECLQLSSAQEKEEGGRRILKGKLYERCVVQRRKGEEDDDDEEEEEECCCASAACSPSSWPCRGGHESYNTWLEAGSRWVRLRLVLSGWLGEASEGRGGVERTNERDLSKRLFLFFQAREECALKAKDVIERGRERDGKGGGKTS